MTMLFHNYCVYCTKMSSLRLFVLCLSRCPMQLRSRIFHTSTREASRLVTASRGHGQKLSWSGYSALNTRFRELCSAAENLDKENPKDEGISGLRLSDSCIQVGTLHTSHTHNINFISHSATAACDGRRWGEHAQNSRRRWGVFGVPIQISVGQQTQCWRQVSNDY